MAVTTMANQIISPIVAFECGTVMSAGTRWAYCTISNNTAFWSKTVCETLPKEVPLARQFVFNVFNGGLYGVFTHHQPRASFYLQLLPGVVASFIDNLFYEGQIPTSSTVASLNQGFLILFVSGAAAHVAHRFFSYSAAFMK